MAAAHWNENFPSYSDFRSMPTSDQLSEGSSQQRGSMFSQNLSLSGWEQAQAQASRQHFYDYEERQPNHSLDYDFLRTASQAELLRCENAVYMELLVSNHTLNARIQELLNTAPNSIHAKQEQMSTSIHPASSSSSTAPGPYAAPATHISKPLRRSDYPNMKYWTKRKYADAMSAKRKAEAILNPNGKPSTHKRGGKRLAEDNVNVSMEYIEEEDGTTIAGDKAVSIRSFARTVFNEMEKREPLPAVWGNIGSLACDFFTESMVGKYPILALCEDNWKVLHMASRLLTNRHQKMLKSNKVKKEVIDDNLPVRSANKRKAPPSTTFSPDSDTDGSPDSKRIRHTADEVDLTGLLSMPPDTASDAANSETITAVVGPVGISASLPVINHEPSPSPTILPTSAPEVATSAPQTTTVAAAHNVELPLESQVEGSSTVSAEAAAVVVVSPGTVLPVASPAGAIDNPFASLFGPPSGPTIRLKSLAVSLAKPVKKTAKGTSSTTAVKKPRGRKAKTSNEPNEFANSAGPATIPPPTSAGAASDVDLTPGVEMPTATLAAPGTEADAQTAVAEATADPETESSMETTEVEKNGSIVGRAESASNTANVDESSLSGAVKTRYHQTMPGMKKTTGSNSPKNLCYVDYLQLYGATTPAQFEAYWAGLGKDTQNYYATRSKRLKAIEKKPELLNDEQFIAAAPVQPSLPAPSPA
ncbi:hypothetical protein CPC08DRAFT_771414 [Agrocybe pediades]|nr:hypothetical protein CPC08DRAFT_771414 [Agrocybe pediades]